MKAELIDYFGDDLMVVNAARVSYGKTKKEFDNKDEKLIKYLVDHKHIAPFRHPQLQFRIECPIFVERQCFKHQVGMSANCLHGDSLVRFKKNGMGNKDIKIKDLYNQWSNGRPHQNTEKDKQYVRKRISSMRLRVMNEETGGFEYGNVKNVFKSGVKEVFEITTECGNKIKCSKNHKIWTNEGWKTIDSGLSQGDKIGLNGVQAAGKGTYRDKSLLKEDRENGLSVSEMSKKHECSYHTIRKWLKIHKLSFSKEETCFKKGENPWNFGVKGYRLTLTQKRKDFLKRNKAYKEEKALEKYSKMGEKDISSSKKIAFNKFAKKTLLKYKDIYYLDILSDDLELHHIIPSRVAPDLYFQMDNVILISRERHIKIHSNWQNELDFAKNIMGEDFVSQFEFKKETNTLKVHFSKIESIKSIGNHDTYDIEVEGPHHNFVSDNVVVHNSISGRYVDFSDNYYHIESLRKQSKSSKQGSDGIIDRPDLIDKINKHIESCKELYSELCEADVAKEQARVILPLCLETQYIWTGSLLAFFHFWNLRLKEDTQKETRLLAEEMLSLVKNIKENPFKHSLKAFGY